MEDNSDSNWVFDSLSKKSSITKLMTVMNGSVVTAGAASKGSKSNKRSRNNANKENARPKKAARGRARANVDANVPSAAPAKSITSGMLETFAEETMVGETTVSCNVGMRCKLWLDDLLACVNHVVAQVGRIGGVSDENLRDLKIHLLRTGIIFALKGSIMLQTEKNSKTFRKWSSLRPALSEHALWHLIQAWYLSLFLFAVTVALFPP